MRRWFRMITQLHTGVSPRSALLCRWTRPYGSLAEATHVRHSSSTEDPPTAYACLGIDTDMNGAIVLLKCQRRDRIVLNGLGEGEKMADWCKNGMLNAQAKFWDMPTYKYSLASGKLRRRPCGHEFNRIVDQVLADEQVQEARKAGRFTVVVERPSPMPDIDGWQSAAACAYTFGVLMGVLSSHSLISLDQQLRSRTKSMNRGRGRPRAAANKAIIEVLAVQWKRQMQLQGASKDDSRELAAEILPSLASDLRRKKDHGRAEAALLAVWGAMLSSSHLAARASTVEPPVPSDADTSHTFNPEEQTQRLRKLIETA